MALIGTGVTVMTMTITTGGAIFTASSSIDTMIVFVAYYQFWFFR